MIYLYNKKREASRGGGREQERFLKDPAFNPNGFPNGFSKNLCQIYLHCPAFLCTLYRLSFDGVATKNKEERRQG